MRIRLMPHVENYFIFRRIKQRMQCNRQLNRTQIRSQMSGIAVSNKLKGNGNYAVAVVGDGALTNGMIYEALNNCADKKLKIFSKNFSVRCLKRKYLIPERIRVR